MKRFILLLALFPGLVMAQNWVPISPNEKYAYTKQGDAYATKFIQDSLIAPSTYWLGSSAVEKSDTLFSQSANGFETVGDVQLFGHLYYISADSTYSFHKIDDLQVPELVIKKNAALNDVWIIHPKSGELAEVVAIQSGQIFNQTDSFKVIVNQTSLDTLVLSKNHGIVYSSTDSLGYALSGMYEAGHGNYPPRLKEIYNFEVADVFVVSSGGCNALKNISCHGMKRKIEILSKTETDSGFIYTYNEMSYSTYRVGVGMTTYSYHTPTIQTVNVHPKAELWGMPVYIALATPYELFDISKTMPQSSYSGPSDLYAYPQIAHDSVVDYIKVDGMYQPISWNSSTDTLFNNHFDNIQLEARPSLGITKMHYMNFETSMGYRLEGYIRNGDTMGTIATDGEMLAINNIDNNHRIEIYPNPSSNIITIESSKTIESIEIIALDGKLVWKENNIQELNKKIDISGLGNQVLIIRVCDKDGHIHHSKIVKTSN